MTDFHAHILPGMDDGSRDTEESLAMLRAAADQGIRRIAATSHFYPMDESPETFLKRRRMALEALLPALEPGMPEILPGAEVYFFHGISHVKEISQLRIEGTRLLLLEMPFSPWTDGMIAEVQQLARLPELIVLLAHVERYMRWQKQPVWDMLLDSGILLQSNAEFFIPWQTRHRARRMLESGMICLLGSDCHNMTSRPPRMGDAMKAIGPKGLQILEDNTRIFAP